MAFDLSPFDFERLHAAPAKLASKVKLYNVPELKPLICSPFIPDDDETRNFPLGSSTPDLDLVSLKNKLDSIKLSSNLSLGGGDCTIPVPNPVSSLRSETLFNVFDDLVGRITTGCHEQGSLLDRIRTDIFKTVANFQKHYINTIAHSSQMQLKLLSRIEQLHEQIEMEKTELLKLEALEQKSSDQLVEKASEESIVMSQARGRQMDLLEIAEQKKEKLKELILRAVKPPLEEEEEEEVEQETETKSLAVEDAEIIT